MEAHAAHALLSAGSAVRAESRAATAPARGLRDAGIGPGAGRRLGQRSGARPHPDPAPRNGGVVGLPQLRASLARAEDGAIPRRSRRVPARSWAARAALCTT